MHPNKKAYILRGIIRPATAIVPGAFDTMQTLQVAYALFGVRQLIRSSIYTGYAYRVQRSSDNATKDFLPNSTALQVATWGQAAGAAQLYLIKLYDQSGSSLDSDTGTIGVAGTSPTLDCSISVYPVAVFNGTTQRIAWSNTTMRDINTTAPGITLSCAMQATATNSATAFYQSISQNASGNSSRTSIDFLTTPTFSVRTNRVDGTATSANTPTSWDLNPHIITNVTDLPGGTVKRYIDGTAGTTGSFTAVASPNFARSAAVFIGGLSTGSFAAMRWTCSAFYNVALTGSNLTALETAMEASA